MQTNHRTSIDGREHTENTGITHSITIITLSKGVSTLCSECAFDPDRMRIDCVHTYCALANPVRIRIQLNPPPEVVSIRIAQLRFAHTARNEVRFALSCDWSRRSCLPVYLLATSLPDCHEYCMGVGTGGATGARAPLIFELTFNLYGWIILGSTFACRR